MKGQLCMTIILLCQYAAASINSLKIAEESEEPQNPFQTRPSVYINDGYWHHHKDSQNMPGECSHQFI